MPRRRRACCGSTSTTPATSSPAPEGSDPGGRAPRTGPLTTANGRTPSPTTSASGRPAPPSLTSWGADVAEDPFGDVYDRTFVGVCTSSYEAEVAYPRLEKAPAELAAIRDWLCSERLGQRALTPADLPPNPRMKPIEGVFLDEDSYPRFRAKDAVVVYVTGHGIFPDDGGGHRLVL